jgi:hypothetical protein
MQSLTSVVDAAKDDILRSSSTSTSAPSLTNIQVLANGLTPPEVASDSGKQEEDGEAPASHSASGPAPKPKSRGRQFLSSAKHALSKRMTALSGYHSEVRAVSRTFLLAFD